MNDLSHLSELHDYDNGAIVSVDLRCVCFVQRLPPVTCEPSGTHFDARTKLLLRGQGFADSGLVILVKETPLEISAIAAEKGGAA